MYCTSEILVTLCVDSNFLCLFPPPVCWLLLFLSRICCCWCCLQCDVVASWLLFCHASLLWWWFPLWPLLLLFCDTIVMLSWWCWCFGGCRCRGCCLVTVFDGGCGPTEEDRSGARKPPSQWKVSDLDIILSEPTEMCEGHQSPQEGDSNNCESLEGAQETCTTSSIGDRLATPTFSLPHLHLEVGLVY